MKSPLLILTSFLFCLTTQANWGLYAGLNSTKLEPQEPISGFDFQPVIGASFGLTKLIDLEVPVLIRTGLGVATRGVEVDIGSTTSDNTVITLEVPATALYEFNPMVGVFAGLNFLYELDAGCNPDDGYCSQGDIKLFQELVLGTQVNLSFVHSIELEYAQLLNRLENDILWTTISARYIYWFD